MNGDMAWLARAVPPEQWSQVRITRVAPITALLRKETRNQIAELYSTLLTYLPVTLMGPVTWNNKSLESTQHALKTITSIVIRSSANLESLDVVYSDNTRSGKHGGNGGTERVITLSNGEYITEVFVWADAEWIFAVQFVTNYRRVSPHYGGEEGIPTILRSEDGVLVALSSTWGKHPKWEVDMIQQIQTIWRHDVSQTRLELQNSHFNYFGGSGGRPFNDLPFLESLDSAYISHIKISCGSLIDGIQVFLVLCF
ncbi:hypothetical protein BDV93DRAFT_193602 [Ceratobasidium sp. AG-I]|nr:hypothetical protein BDV93DRAFT_193602 [Ceratobasidium sp. AG-I]